MIVVLYFISVGPTNAAVWLNSKDGSNSFRLSNRQLSFHFIGWKYFDRLAFLLVSMADLVNV